MTPVSPEKTFAIVVGIERYDAGEKWNLDGPAVDACRFTEWLLDCGVPTSNISLHLSPLTKNDGLALPNGVTAQDATSGRFEKLLTESLPKRNEDLLIFYWGGHGVMQADGTRYLFTQNASSVNKRTLPLNDLLKFLRSNAIPASTFSQQIVIVDTCANYAEPRTMATALTAIPFPFGNSIVESRTQFSLMAASPGEKASNLNTEQTGLFSLELRPILALQPTDAWPPDMETLTKLLIQRFVTLRNEGKAKQSPAYFSAGQWGVSERTLGSVPSQAIANPNRTVVSLQDKQRLADALLECPSIADRDDRKAVLRQIRKQIVTAIPEGATPLSQVINIVDTCLRYQGGMAELLRALRVLDRDEAVQTLDILVQQILPQVYEESH